MPDRAVIATASAVGFGGSGQPRAVGGIIVDYDVKGDGPRRTPPHPRTPWDSGHVPRQCLCLSIPAQLIIKRTQIKACVFQYVRKIVGGLCARDSKRVLVFSRERVG